MARLNVPFYQAHQNNYTPGRSGHSIKYFTVHHSAGWENSLRGLWQNPSRGGSSHLWVGNTKGAIEQYVDFNDTAWTNGNWTSNCESITCETRGDWRGYYDQTTLDNLSEAMYQCLKLYPNLALTFHQDVSSVYTLCPAELKHNGHALQAWNRAKERLEPAPAPVPTPKPALELVMIDIPNKIFVTTKDVQLWDLTFSKWTDAKGVKALPKGTQIEVSAVVDHPLGGRYLISEYSFSKGIFNGVNVADVVEYKEPAKPVQPTPVEPEKPEVSTPEVPQEKPEEQTPQKPETDVNPSEPAKDDDLHQLQGRFDKLVGILRAFVDKLIAIFSKEK